MLERLPDGTRSVDCLPVGGPQNPQETSRPRLNGIDQALKQGHKLHGFLSVRGLGVIRLELDSRLTGYGEHPNPDEALVHADEDFLAGGSDYDKVYDKLHPHYLYVDGSEGAGATSPLAGWFRQGYTTLDADYKTDEGKTVVALTGLIRVEQPKEVWAQVKADHKPIVWTDRGFTYETTYNPHSFPVGDEGCSTRVIGVPEGRDENEAWRYFRVKSGEGDDFSEALEKAFAAPNREIEDPYK